MSPLAETAEARPGSTGRVVRAAVPCPDVDPSAFLRAVDPPRGYWARDGAWSARGGTAAIVEVRRETDGSRFGEVRARAGSVFSAVETVRGAGDGRPELAPRLYGGFSFHDDHTAGGGWEGFPAASFRLPSLELRGTADGEAWLLGAWPAREGEDGAGEAALERLRSERDRLLERAGPTGAGTAGAPDRSSGASPDLPAREVVGYPAWEAAVEEALDAVEAGGLRKVVLARAVEVDAPPSADPASVAARLEADNPGAYPFLLEPAEGSVLVGAAPELLAVKEDERFTATAVAGTIRRGTDPEEDRRLAHRLLSSAKDQAEHAIGVEDMRERLVRVTGAARVDAEPHLLRLRGMHHLQTDLTARIPEEEHVLGLVEALHPTAAVNGHPREEALRFLREHEGFRRGWYAGPVGWFDAAGDGEFVPALRCALLHGGVARLFAGAGIVEGSSPRGEWDETALKFEPVLRALAGGPAG